MFSFLKSLFSGGNKTAEIHEMLANGAIILDARTPAEFKDGHIPKATNFPVQTIGANISKIKKMNKPVVAYCQSGIRSGAAVATLKSAGIQAINAGSMYKLDAIMHE